MFYSINISLTKHLKKVAVCYDRATKSSLENTGKLGGIIPLVSKGSLEKNN